MNSHDWALIIFTILAQMSVGSFLVLSLIQLFAARKYEPEQVDLFNGWGWWAIFITMVIAVAASLTHLGNPLNAPLAILNIGSAWLSREILFALLFTLFAGGYALLNGRKMGSPGLRAVVALLAAVCGIALVFSMSMIYNHIRTVPSWNTPMTIISFSVTTLLLGALGAGTIVSANYFAARDRDPGCVEIQCSLLRSSLRGISLAAIVLLGVEVIVLPVFLTSLATSAGAGLATAELLFNEFGILLVLRILLVFTGAGIITFFLYRTTADEQKEQLLGSLTYGAFAIVLLAEVIGRYLFYAANIHTGI